MKILFLLLMCILVMAGCISKSSKKDIESTMNIRFSSAGKVIQDSIYLTLYPLDSFVSTPYGYNDVVKPKYSFTLIDSIFSFRISKGYYKLVAFTFGFERLCESVMIPDSTITLNMFINFSPRGINHVVKNVKIYGDFCGWAYFRGIDLTRYGNIWKLEDKSMLPMGAQYQFFPGQTRHYYDLSNKVYIPNRENGTFNSVYTGKDIIFDPSQYLNPITESTVKCDGYKKQEHFAKLTSALTKLEISQIWKNYDYETKEHWSKGYQDILKDVLELKDKYDSVAFKQIYNNHMIHMLSSYHPYKYELNKLNKEKANTERHINFYRSEEYRDYFTKMLDLIKQIDPESDYFRSGNFIKILELDNALKYVPELIDKSYSPSEKKDNENIYEDYFAKYAEDIESHGISCMEGSHLLWYLSGYYYREEKGNKLRKTLKRLSTVYPNSGYQELIAKKYSAMSIQEGQKVPEFSIKTIDNGIIKLSDFQDQYLFLYFWAMPCLHSMREQKNVEKLSMVFDSKRLQVIGFSEPEKSNPEWLIQEYNISYPTAIITEDISQNFGVIYWPMTLLIAPGGVIIAKDLRGENLVEKVKNSIESYENRGR